MFDKVMLAMDMSERTDELLPAFYSLCPDTETEVYLLHVAEKEQDDEDILLSSSAGRVYVLRILDDSMAESDEKTLQSGFEVLE